MNRRLANEGSSVHVQWMSRYIDPCCLISPRAPNSIGSANFWRNNMSRQINKFKELCLENICISSSRLVLFSWKVVWIRRYKLSQWVLCKNCINPPCLNSILYNSSPARSHSFIWQDYKVFTLESSKWKTNKQKHRDVYVYYFGRWNDFICLTGAASKGCLTDTGCNKTAQT